MIRIGLLVALGAAPVDEVARWHRVVGLLEYVEGDFAAAVATGSAAELLEQRGFLDEVARQLEAAGPDGRAWTEEARRLEGLAAASDPSTARASGELARRIVAGRGLSRAPRRPPSLEQGAVAYATHCASCHGEAGRGDGPAGKGLEPRPADFHAQDRRATLTPYKVFNTTSFGIPGTGMPAFGDRASEDERWSLAFFVAALAQPACLGRPPQASWETLAASTDANLASAYGSAAVPCLRRHLPEPGLASLELAVQGLSRAVEEHRHGDRDQARQAVVDAYLLGLEPVEPLLRSRDPRLVARLEASFTRARLAADGDGDFEREARETLALVERARETEAKGFWAIFLAAFIILIREGFEAVVVVGALLAVLKKLGARSLVRVVHAAWVSALGLGVTAYFFGRALFEGANREWLESVVALVAVGLLVYAAVWLNARAGMSRFLTEVRAKMGTAVARGSVGSLFAIAFTSVGRESLETALFLEGLATDSSDAVLAGAAAGLLGLAALLAVVRLVGFRLPMKALFAWSTALLLATAVMLLGKGLHGLQELGVLPLQPVPFVSVEALGLYADAVSLVPQLLLALAVGAWWWVAPSKPGRAPPEAPRARPGESRATT